MKKCYFSFTFLRIWSHFWGLQIAKIKELPGALPPGPPPGRCPGLTRGPRRPPWPLAFFPDFSFWKLSPMYIWYLYSKEAPPMPKEVSILTLGYEVLDSNSTGDGILLIQNLYYKEPIIIILPLSQYNWITVEMNIKHKLIIIYIIMVYSKNIVHTALVCWLIIWVLAACVHVGVIFPQHGFSVFAVSIAPENARFWAKMKIFFLISPGKHMLWYSLEAPHSFWWVPTTYVFVEK